MTIYETCIHYCGDEDCAKCDKYGILTGGCGGCKKYDDSVRDCDKCAYYVDGANHEACDECFADEYEHPNFKPKAQCAGCEENKNEEEEERLSIWAN